MENSSHLDYSLSPRGLQTNSAISTEKAKRSNLCCGRGVVLSFSARKFFSKPVTDRAWEPMRALVAALKTHQIFHPDKVEQAGSSPRSWGFSNILKLLTVPFKRKSATVENWTIFFCKSDLSYREAPETSKSKRNELGDGGKAGR